MIKIKKLLLLLLVGLVLLNVSYGYEPGCSRISSSYSIYDSFNRADGTLNNTNPDKGGTWILGWSVTKTEVTNITNNQVRFSQTNYEAIHSLTLTANQTITGEVWYNNTGEGKVWFKESNYYDDDDDCGQQVYMVSDGRWWCGSTVQGSKNLPVNQWVRIKLIADSFYKNFTCEIYNVSGMLIDSITSLIYPPACNNLSFFSIGSYGTTNSWVDNASVYNGINCPPYVDGIYINVSDFYDKSPINTFNITISNGTYSNTKDTVNGTIHFFDNEIGINLNFSIYLNAPSYFPFFIKSYNLSTSNYLNLTLIQSELRINTTRINTNYLINNFNVSVPLQSNSTTNGTARLYLKAGVYNLFLQSNDYYDLNQSFSFSPLEIKYLTLYLIPKSINITNCSSGNISITLNIFNEEIPTNQLISNLEIFFDYWSSPLYKNNKSFTFNGSNKYNFCHVPSDYKIYSDIYIKYSVTGGFTHRYYMLNQSLTNITLNVSIYNFDTTTGISDLRGIARYETTYSYYPNIIAKMQRRYVGEGIWRTVQMDKSDDFGAVHFKIKEDTTDYKFIFVDENNNIIKTTNSVKFSCDTALCEVTFLLNPFVTIAGAATELTVNVSFNNATGIITVIFNDPTGNTQNIRTVVTKRDLTLCDVIQSGSSGTYTCDISGHTGDILVRIFSTASPERAIVTKWFHSTYQKLGNVLKNKFGEGEGSFWALAIITTITFAAAVIGVITGLMAFVFSIIIIYYLGIFTVINLLFVMLVIIGGIVIGLMIRRK